jgi:hypothetical protein
MLHKRIGLEQNILNYAKKNLSEVPGAHGRRVLKWIFKEQDMRVWTGFIWLRTGTSGGLL